MDPMTAATAFATTVSLLADFVAHRGVHEGKSFDEFMAWLSEKRHDEIKALLELNTSTTIGIKALLSENQKEILDRLHSLDKSLAIFAAGFDAFRGVAEATHPTAALSPQAISLLEQFNDSGASKVLMHQGPAGTDLYIVDGPTNGSLQFSDLRFLEDDLTTLVELGFLGLEHADNGGRLFLFKRVAARFVEHLRAQ